ncbi:MAG: uracil-DNA glycosylase [Acidiferrobacterales bacterium]
MDRREAVRRQYLEAMGIDLWESRVAEPRSGKRAPTADETTTAVDSSAETQSLGATPTSLQTSSSATTPDVVSLDWDALRNVVRECVKCPLHKSRTQTVFGVGCHDADWMFVGEAPGLEEDRQGEPFVGRAGQLLNAMLSAIGLKREDVYIANVLKCRPPNNRDPQIEEVECCEPYLLRQIELISPRIILALGRHAAHSLLKTDLPLSRLRGRRFSYHTIPLVATYHPAYLLRSPLDKRKAWDDLCLARSIVGEL